MMDQELHMVDGIGQTLTRVATPVPPTLEIACGYHGHARFVGMYWDRIEDDLAWTDGHTSMIGANWAAWATYTRHPKIAPALAPFELGSTTDNARHILVLDRVKRAIRVGEVSLALQFLEGQWKSNGIAIDPPLHMLSEGVFRAQDWTATERLREEVAAVDALKSWLDFYRPAKRPIWLTVLKGGRL